MTDCGKEEEIIRYLGLFIQSNIPDSIVKFFIILFLVLHIVMICHHCSCGSDRKNSIMVYFNYKVILSFAGFNLIWNCLIWFLKIDVIAKARKLIFRQKFQGPCSGIKWIETHWKWLSKSFFFNDFILSEFLIAGLFVSFSNSLWF